MQVRYIKLGQGGGWEDECIKDGIIRYGFDSAKPGRFELCIAGRWNDLQKTLDLDLTLPSTGDRAFVQVKAKTTSAELAEYVGKIDEFGPDYRMFYVYHSGDARTEDDRVIVIGPEKLSEMVLDAGLANWLIRKVS